MLLNTDSLQTPRIITRPLLSRKSTNLESLRCQDVPIEQ